MASETLTIPEDYFKEVILVIRNGLKHTKGISNVSRNQLKLWCNEEEDYLKKLIEP